MKKSTPNHPRGLLKLAQSMTPELRTIFRPYTGNWADTHDLLSELSVRLVSHRGPYPLLPREYIRKLAHDTGAVWRCTTQRALAAQNTLTARYRNAHDTDRTPESVFVSEQHMEMLRVVISEFPRRQKRAWQLVKFEDHSFKEAARIMHISPGTIHTYMRDGMIACRQRLQAQGGLV